MIRTLRIRVNHDDYEFFTALSRDDNSNMSETVCNLIARGRVMLAIEKYRSGEASLGRAAELAGLPVGRMMTVLTDFGVESRLEKEDYLQGLENLRKAW